MIAEETGKAITVNNLRAIQLYSDGVHGTKTNKLDNFINMISSINIKIIY